MILLLSTTNISISKSARSSPRPTKNRRKTTWEKSQERIVHWKCSLPDTYKLNVRLVLRVHETTMLALLHHEQQSEHIADVHLLDRRYDWLTLNERIVHWKLLYLQAKISSLTSPRKPPTPMMVAMHSILYPTDSESAKRRRFRPMFTHRWYNMCYQIVNCIWATDFPLMWTWLVSSFQRHDVL